VVLFVLDGSEHSRKAREIVGRLADVVVASAHTLEGIYRDYGIRQLPALYVADGRWYVGLENIRRFIEEVG